MPLTEDADVVEGILIYLNVRTPYRPDITRRSRAAVASSRRPSPQLPPCADIAERPAFRRSTNWALAAAASVRPTPNSAINYPPTKLRHTLARICEKVEEFLQARPRRMRMKEPTALVALPL